MRYTFGDVVIMSDSSSSKRSSSEKGYENALSAMSPNTPLTSIASPDVLTVDTSDEIRRSRRNSSVRFKELGTLSEPTGQTSVTPASRDVFASPSEKEEWGKAPPQPSLETLEERMNALENCLHSLNFPRPSDFSEKGDSSSERSSLSLEPQWMTWQEYLEPTTKATSILEVLVEKPHTNTRRRSSVIPPINEALAGGSEVKNIERIRFRSVHITSALQQITEQTFPNLSCFTIHRPFKILLFYRDAIKEYVSELEETFNRVTSCPWGDHCKARYDYDKQTFRPFYNYHLTQNEDGPKAQGGLSAPLADEPQSYKQINEEKNLARSPPGKQHGLSDYARRRQTFSSEDLDDNDCRHEESDDLLAQSEAIAHLRALLKFMREDMREVFERHELLRSSKAEQISFIDIWHIFMAGDLVVTNDESDWMMYRVSILPAHQFFSSRRPVKEMKLRSDGSHQQVESVYSQEPMNVMEVDCYYYNFDGRNFGPVERRYVISQDLPFRTSVSGLNHPATIQD